MEDYGLRELHSKIIEIMVYFDEFCKNNKIDYYLSGGCSLGAVRHKGFIPWDDDMDVCMTDENHQKFLKACTTSLDKEKYYLQLGNSDEFPNYLTKLRCNGTTYIEKYNIDIDMHKGFFIDIYCLDNISDNYFIGFLQFLCAKFLIIRVLPKVNYQTTSIVKKILRATWSESFY